MATSITTRYVIAGLHIYRDTSWTDEQMKDIALFTAASAALGLMIGKPSFIRYDTTDDGTQLVSNDLLERIINSHDDAEQLRRLVTEEMLLTEHQLISRLDGVPSALIDGSL